MTKFINWLNEHPAAKIMGAVLGGAFLTLFVQITTDVIRVAIRKPISDSIGLFIHDNYLFFAIATGIFALVAVLAAGVYFLKDYWEIGFKRKDERYTRFEDFDEHGVRFGYVPFFPTLKLNPETDAAEGFGVDLLRFLFEGRTFSSADPARNWGTIINGLINKEYDVIATPLYELRERSRLVSFTSPVFYADIGLFVPTGGKLAREAGKGNCTFEEVQKLLRKHEADLTIVCMEGEIQEHFAKKHSPKSERVHPPEKEYSVRHFLGMLCRGSEPSSDFLFCERWQAERHPEFNKDKGFINLLKPGEMLVPVGFAVRKSDDTLRKFINLQLLALQRDGTHNTIDFLADSFREQYSEDVTDKIQDYYYLSYVQDKKEVLGDGEVTNLSDYRR